MTNVTKSFTTRINATTASGSYVSDILESESKHSIVIGGSFGGENTEVFTITSPAL
jgi:hypothetical protein